ncbi:MAG: GerAB/ArcD/ProY family transporter [Lutisporaceae bacterium]|jgi:spore germination protein KB
MAICNKIFSTTPGYITKVIGNTGWYMTLISCATALVFFGFIYLLLKRFPGRNIIEIYDASLGRVMGFIFSFLLMVSFLLSVGIYTREFTDILKIYALPATPPSVIIGTMIFAAVVAAFLGIETIARVAKLAFYPALVGYFLILIFSLNIFKPTNLLPIFGYGLDKTVITGILRGSAYDEVVILAVFAGSLQGIEHIKKAGFISLLLSGFIISSGLLCFALVFEYRAIQELTIVAYVMTRKIAYGTFFQRMDPIFLLLWIITTSIYISILFYTTVSIYCKIFRLQDAKPVVVPMAVLAVSAAIFPRDFSSVLSVYVQGLRNYGNITFFIMPAIALGIAVIRNKKGESKCAD